MPGIKEFKSLFETPQKARITVICALVALATVGAVIAYVIYSIGSGAGAPPAESAPPERSEAVSDAPAEPTPAESGTPAVSEAPSQNLMGIVPTLTIDEARALALADAGTTEDEADVSREALSEDNGIWVYEFRFRTGTARYEYRINANTGEVRGKVREAVIDPGAEASVPAGGSPEEDAAQIPSAGQTPAPSPAAGTPAPSPTPDQSASMYIGISRAKTIALDHAGLSADQAAFTRVRMAREDGRMVYQIRFRQGRAEYGYEIDAATGRVLSHSRDGE